MLPCDPFRVDQCHTIMPMTTTPSGSGLAVQFLLTWQGQDNCPSGNRSQSMVMSKASTADKASCIVSLSDPDPTLALCVSCC